MRKTLVGTVVSDRNSKTRRVDVQRVFQHTKYKKIVRGRITCYVHDENNESKAGDTVEIAESRPHSATKRWELVRVVKSVGVIESQLARADHAVSKAPGSENAEAVASENAEAPGNGNAESETVTE